MLQGTIFVLVLLGFSYCLAFNQTKLCGHELEHVENRDLQKWTKNLLIASVSMDPEFKCYTLKLVFDDNDETFVSAIFKNGSSTVHYNSTLHGHGRYITYDNLNRYEVPKSWGFYVYKEDEFYLVCQCIDDEFKQCYGIVKDKLHVPKLTELVEEKLKSAVKLYPVWNDECELQPPSAF